MKYALRNIIRIPHRTLMMSLVLVTVLTLLMWSVLTAVLCSSAIESYTGHGEEFIELRDGNRLIPQDIVPVSMKYVELLDEAYDIVTDAYAYWIWTADLPGTDPLPGTSDSTQISYDWGAHRVYLCTDMSITPDMMDGRIEMVEGEPITQADYDAATRKVVISEDLAARNGYKLGDTVQIYMYYQYFGHEYERTMTFTIGGIFCVRELVTGTPEHCYQITANDLYVPLSIAWKSLGIMEAQITPARAYFAMENPDVQTVERLEEGMRNMLSNEISLELSEPDDVTQGIAKLLMLARAAAILLCVCGLVAFLVMLLLNLQSRTKEFGILTALGKKPRQTSNIFLCEVAVIALVSLFVSMLLFELTADIGADALRSFLISESVLTEQTNTTMLSLLDEMLISHEQMSIGASLQTACSMAIGAVGVVIAAAYLLIRIYLKRVNILRVLGGGEG